jgi:hypothetical protein
MIAALTKKENAENGEGISRMYNITKVKRKEIQR